MGVIWRCGKLLKFLEALGISLWAGYLSNLLIKNHSGFETEKKEVYDSGLASSPWQHFDQTGARVGGVNYTTNVICNPLYTVYSCVLKGLQPGRELKFMLNPLTFSLIQDFKIPTKWQNALQLLPQETVWSESQFNHLLNNYLPKLGDQQLTRIREAAGIAFYHQQTDDPVVQTQALWRCSPIQVNHCWASFMLGAWGKTLQEVKPCSRLPSSNFRAVYRRFLGLLSGIISW